MSSSRLFKNLTEITKNGVALAGIVSLNDYLIKEQREQLKKNPNCHYFIFPRLITSGSVVPVDYQASNTSKNKP